MNIQEYIWKVAIFEGIPYAIMALQIYLRKFWYKRFKSIEHKQVFEIISFLMYLLLLLNVINLLDLLTNTYHKTMPIWLLLLHSFSLFIYIFLVGGFLEFNLKATRN